MRFNLLPTTEYDIPTTSFNINPLFQVTPFNLTIPKGLTNADDIYTVKDPTGERIFGFEGADKITGGTGNDILNGGLGSDTLYGGVGDDELWGGPGVEIDYLYGEGGNDKLYGEAGNDVLDGGAGQDMLDGGVGDDTLAGDAGADEIWGQDGNDTVDAGADNDRVYAGDGADTVRGGLGDDVINGGNQNDILYGDDGQDVLWGGTGDDTLYGGAGDDKLFGETGNDILDGGAGSNVLSGGTGDDTYYSKGYYDEMWGGGGYDTYKLNPYYTYYNVAVIALIEPSANTSLTTFGGLPLKTKMIFEDSEGGLIDLTNYLTANITVTLKKTSGDQLILTTTNSEMIVVNGWATGKISFKVGDTPYSIWNSSNVNANLAISTNKEMTIVNPTASISVASLPSLNTNYDTVEQQLNTPLKNVLTHFEAKKLQETYNIQNTDAVEIANAKYSNIGVEFWKHGSEWSNVAVNDIDSMAMGPMSQEASMNQNNFMLNNSTSSSVEEKSKMELSSTVNVRLSLLMI